MADAGARRLWGDGHCPIERQPPPRVADHSKLIQEDRCRHRGRGGRRCAFIRRPLNKYCQTIGVVGTLRDRGRASASARAETGTASAGEGQRNNASARVRNLNSRQPRRGRTRRRGFAAPTSGSAGALLLAAAGGALPGAKSSAARNRPLLLLLLGFLRRAGVRNGRRQCGLWNNGHGSCCCACGALAALGRARFAAPVVRWRRRRIRRRRLRLRHLLLRLNHRRLSAPLPGAPVPLRRSVPAATCARAYSSLRHRNRRWALQSGRRGLPCDRFKVQAAAVEARNGSALLPEARGRHGQVGRNLEGEWGTKGAGERYCERMRREEWQQAV